MSAEVSVIRSFSRRVASLLSGASDLKKGFDSPIAPVGISRDVIGRLRAETTRRATRERDSRRRPSSRCFGALRVRVAFVNLEAELRKDSHLADGVSALRDVAPGHAHAAVDVEALRPKHGRAVPPLEDEVAVVGGRL